MRISVIIPAFNRADLLPQTIDSVLAQTRLPDEIVVVDDGSTDDTVAVMARYAAANPMIRYMPRENGGLPAARNTGAESATGDALLFLDSDDLLAPTAVARLETALASDPNAVLAFCRARYIDREGRSLIIPNTALFDEPEAGEMWKHLLKGNCIRSAGGVLLRAEALRQAGGWDETLRSNEDWDMWIRLAETGKGFVCVPDALLLYRIHGTNMSGNRAVMQATALRVYEKALARNEAIPARRAEVKRNYDASVKDHPAFAPNNNEVAQVIVLPAGVDADAVYDANSRQRHLGLRRLIEQTGIAALYRKTPMTWRLRLRSLFGVDPNA